MPDPALVDPDQFRKVLSHWATGVAVVTATHENKPVGLAVTSFTSVSLDPPLVLFCADKGSRSWPKIEKSGGYCVNLLRHDQEHVCNTFAGKSDDKFAEVDWSQSEQGSPVLDDALAWIDCTLFDVVDAGDHFLAIGQVLDAYHDEDGHPLLFFRSSYGQIER